MLNLRSGNHRDVVPECVRNTDLVIVDLDVLLEDFPLPERSVSKEITDYLHWKYDQDLIFDPLYGDVQKLSKYVSGALLPEAYGILRVWEARCAAWASPRQGMVELIRRIRDDGVIVAVTSTRMQRTATKLLRLFGLARSVDMVVGGDDVYQPRPDPEPLELVFNATGITTQESVFIGSRRSDLEMGRRVGVPTYDFSEVV